MSAFNETAAEIADVCSDRAEMYRLLASLIDREVTSRTCGFLANLAAASVDESADEDERRCAEGLRTMGACTVDFDDDLSDVLACDFARVFLAAGCYDDKAAVPYESIYTSEEGILMQEARDEVRAIFRQAGVMPGGDENIPEDYLPFELEYMALLADSAAEAADKDDAEETANLLEEQRDFLNAHIMNWVDRLIVEIDRMASTPFYHGLADALGGFLHDDQKGIQALIDACDCTAELCREAC